LRGEGERGICFSTTCSANLLSVPPFLSLGFPPSRFPAREEWFAVLDQCTCRRPASDVCRLQNCTRDLHEMRHTVSGMKKVTFSAEESLIEQARLVARSQRKRLSAAFREWLERYTARAGGGAAVDALMHRLQHVCSGGPYTRDGMSRR